MAQIINHFTAPDGGWSPAIWFSQWGAHRRRPPSPAMPRARRLPSTGTVSFLIPQCTGTPYVTILLKLTFVTTGTNFLAPESLNSVGLHSVFASSSLLGQVCCTPYVFAQLHTVFHSGGMRWANFSQRNSLFFNASQGQSEETPHQA